MRREKSKAIIMVMKINVQVKGVKVRLKKRWLDAFEIDMRSGQCIQG